MSLRWRRYLPRFPAVLVLIAVLGIWFVVCTAPRRDPLDTQVFHREPGTEGLVRRDPMGFPFVFAETKDESAPGVGFRIVRHYDAGIFLVDLALALATAYFLAMVLDRLVFPWLRRRRQQERATPPEPS